MERHLNNPGPPLMLIMKVVKMVVEVIMVVVLVMVVMEGHLNNCGCPIQGSRSKPNFEFSPPLL